MYIEHLYTGCLSQAAYYIESDGEAAIIDPLRDPRPYLEKAWLRKARIRYIFETHFHADFVSGHVDLAMASGAPVVFGPTTLQTGFEAHIGWDGEEFRIGRVGIRLIHTPGHTLESTCYLLLDEEGRETALFTGDTLFLGDVGRPDLAGGMDPELTPEKLASLLYDSLRNKIMPLPDHITIYPGHGAGSACGKKLSADTHDTLWHQKATNYALRAGQSKEEFISELLHGLTPAPAYFPGNVLLNVKGYEPFGSVLNRGHLALSPAAFEAAAKETQALILDTRPSDEFVNGFVPGSVGIGLDGNFAVWAGTLIPDLKQKILLVCIPGREEEAISRLSRVGFEQTIGYLSGGYEAWKADGRESDSIPSVSPQEFALVVRKQPDAQILDVRKSSEFQTGHLRTAHNIPLEYFNQHLASVNPQKETWVYCAGGYRSVIFISILKARGYQNLINVEGGYNTLKATGILPVSEFRIPAGLV